MHEAAIISKATPKPPPAKASGKAVGQESTREEGREKLRTSINERIKNGGKPPVMKSEFERRLDNKDGKCIYVKCGLVCPNQAKCRFKHE